MCCCTFRRQHLFLHLVSDWGKRSPGTVSLMNLLFGSLPSCLRGGISLKRSGSPLQSSWDSRRRDRSNLEIAEAPEELPRPRLSLRDGTPSLEGAVHPRSRLLPTSVPALHACCSDMMIGLPTLLRELGSATYQSNCPQRRIDRAWILVAQLHRHWGRAPAL